MSNDTNGQEEQRGFSRSTVRVRVKLFADGSPPIEGGARDLSMNGVFVECDTSLPEGSECRIELSLDLVHVEAKGKVARLTDHGVAVNFSEIVGIESFDHLRHLVLYNNPDPEQVLSESKHHIGIRRSQA